MKGDMDGGERRQFLLVGSLNENKKGTTWKITQWKLESHETKSDQKKKKRRPKTAASRGRPTSATERTAPLPSSDSA